MNSSPFCSGMTFTPPITISIYLCGSEIVKNKESMSPIAAESTIALFDETLISVNVGAVLSNLTIVPSVVELALGPIAPPKSVYSMLKDILPSSSSSSII